MPQALGGLGPGVGRRERPPDQHRAQDEQGEQAVGAGLGVVAPGADVAGAGHYQGGGQGHERGDPGHLEHVYVMAGDGPAEDHQYHGPTSYQPGPQVDHRGKGHKGQPGEQAPHHFSHQRFPFASRAPSADR